jgi:hypothetical protein
MGTNDVHGAIRQMTLTTTYKASVNETETITDAQAISGEISPSNRSFRILEPAVGRPVVIVAVTRNLDRS